jgi:hypothetical protein
MGAILKKSGWRRSSFLVSSKVFFGHVGDRPNEDGLSRKHVVEACHEALARLQVDYLDLYYCHRPDPSVPVEETCRAMHDLIVQGKVLYWGTSEWSASQIEAAHAVCDALCLHHPIVEQPQYNLFHRARVEKELPPLPQPGSRDDHLVAPRVRPSDREIQQGRSEGHPARCCPASNGCATSSLRSPESRSAGRRPEARRDRQGTGNEPPLPGDRVVPEESQRQHGHPRRIARRAAGREPGIPRHRRKTDAPGDEREIDAISAPVAD